MKKGVVIIQDKNYNSKLPTMEVKKVIAKFKEIYSDYENHPQKEVIGFELNGGYCMTKSGIEKWEEFKSWCQNKSLDTEYNTNDEVQIIRNELRYRESIKNKY